MNLPVAAAVHDLSADMVCLGHCDQWLALHGRASHASDGSPVSVVGLPHARAFPGRDAARWVEVHEAVRRGEHRFSLDDVFEPEDGSAAIPIAWWMFPALRDGVLRGTFFLAVRRDQPESALIAERLAEQRLGRTLAELLP